MSTATIFLLSLGLLILFLIFLFNSLVRLRNQVRNAWAQIDVQLKRRADLIPNLVATVKGYAKHEKSLLTEVTRARSSLVKARSVRGKAAADNALSATLKSLFAVAENYPDLKANQNFLQLQEELSGTENKVAYARQFYNDIVMRYNTRIQTFPNNLFASILGFKEEEPFEAAAGEREKVTVTF